MRHRELAGCHAPEHDRGGRHATALAPTVRHVVHIPTPVELVLYAELRCQIGRNRALVHVVAIALFALIMGTATLIVAHRTRTDRDGQAILAARARAELAESRAATSERRAYALALDAEAARRKLVAAHAELSAALAAIARVEADSAEQRAARELSENTKSAIALATRGDIDAALTAGERALAALRARADRRGEIDLLVSLGDALLAAGEPHDAEKIFLHLLLRLSTSSGPGDRDAAIAAHFGVASAARQRGDLDAAAEHAARARAVAEAAGGDTAAPHVTRALRMLAEIRIVQQDWPEARRLLQRLVPFDAAARPDDLAQLAMIDLHLGALDDAEQSVARMLAAKPRPAPPTLRKVAYALIDRGRYDAAIALLEQASSAADGDSGGGDWTFDGDAHRLARLYVRRGRYPQAEALYRRLLGQREQKAGAHDPDLAECAHELGELYERQAKYGPAEALYKLALQVREKALGADHPDVARSATALADLYQVQGRLAEAAALSALAQGIRERSIERPTAAPAPAR